MPRCPLSSRSDIMKHSIRPAFIFLIPLLIAFISCGPDEHHGRIDGELEGINQARILAIPAIMTAADAIEFIMAGATAIEIGTANFIDPTVTIKVRDGINSWLDNHGCKSVEEIIGVAE